MKYVIAAYNVFHPHIYVFSSPFPLSLPRSPPLSLSLPPSTLPPLSPLSLSLPPYLPFLSQDSLMCIKAFECLLVCVALNDPLVTQAIAHSQFPLLLSSKLKQHLQLLPSSVHYLDIINCKAGWG